MEDEGRKLKAIALAKDTQNNQNTPWVDLNNEQKVERCRRIIRAQGERLVHLERENRTMKNHIHNQTTGEMYLLMRNAGAGFTAPCDEGGDFNVSGNERF